jgi:hypothetical protein
MSGGGNVEAPPMQRPREKGPNGTICDGRRIFGIAWDPRDPVVLIL